MAISFPADFRVQALKNITISVGTSSAQVNSNANLAGFAGYVWVSLYNNSSNTMYWGDSASVTTANGYPLKSTETALIPTAHVDSFTLWVIADGASSDLRVLFLR